MNAIILKNFRCFQETEKISLRPITVLVGENSAGKSSFLSAIRLAWDISHPRGVLDFNEEPFQLGAFNQIAHYRGGKAGRAKQFSIGSFEELRDGDATIEIFREATFSGLTTHPVLASQRIRCGSLEANLVVNEEDEDDSFVEIRSESESTQMPLGEVRLVRSRSGAIDWAHLFYVLSNPPGKSEIAGSSLARDFRNVLRSQRGPLATRKARPLAMAPTRTSPLRTYNPLSEDYHPEGGHIPMLLAKARQDKTLWERLRARLNSFGKASGMFDRIKIKAYGDESDPFQIQVKGLGPGPASNLIDVGYGVSQVLPILVECSKPGRGRTYLLQQPEVHLHPRAQAELGSFFAALVESRVKDDQFVIETHSDYFIDRLRLECKLGRLDPDSVAIHFFDKPNIDAHIHSIRLDSEGNVSGAPKEYRRFFLYEQRRLLRGE